MERLLLDRRLKSMVQLPPVTLRVEENSSLFNLPDRVTRGLDAVNAPAVFSSSSKARWTY